MKKLLSVLNKNRKAIAWVTFVGYVIFSLIYAIRYWNTLDNREYISKYQIKISYMLLAFMVQSLGFLFSIYIWQNILKAYNLSTNYWQDFKRCGYSLLTIMLPGKVLYHLGRMTLYHNDGVEGRVVGVAGISEALLIGIGSLTLYTCCYLFIPDVNLITNIWLSIILAFVSLITLIPSVFKRIVLWTNRSTNQNEKLKPEKYAFIKGVSWVLGETIVVFIGGISLYLFISSFYNLDIESLLIVVAVWAAASASSSLLFWLPGSFLVRDGAMVFVLQRIIPDMQLAFSIIIFHRLWIILTNLFLTFVIWAIFDFPKLLKDRL